MGGSWDTAKCTLPLAAGPYCRHHLNEYVIKNVEKDLYPVEYILVGWTPSPTDLQGITSPAKKLEYVTDVRSLRLFIWKLYACACVESCAMFLRELNLFPRQISHQPNMRARITSLHSQPDLQSPMPCDSYCHPASKSPHRYLRSCCATSNAGITQSVHPSSVAKHGTQRPRGWSHPVTGLMSMHCAPVPKHIQASFRPSAPCACSTWLIRLWTSAL